MGNKVLLASHPHPKFPRLKVQQRSNSKFFQAVTFVAGKMRMKSIHSVHLQTAFKFAEDWYKRELRASVQFGNDIAIRHRFDLNMHANKFSLEHGGADSLDANAIRTEQNLFLQQPACGTSYCRKAQIENTARREMASVR